MGKRRIGQSGHAFEVGGMPVWGLIATAFAFVAIAAFTLTNLPQSQAASSQATPRPVVTFASPATERPVVVFIGDSYTGGSEEDSGEASRWPALVTKTLKLDSTVLARGGSGYVAVGPSGETIGQTAPEIPTDADLVIIFGSRNDTASEDDVRDAANAMYDAVRANAAGARVLVVGPAWVGTDLPRNITASNAALKDAASSHGFDFVAATDTGLLADRDDLIGADAVHPNDAGHAELAAYFLPLIKERLPAA